MDITQLTNIKDSFVSELNNARMHNSSTIPFILNQIGSVQLAKVGSKFQAISIGGTHFKSSICVSSSDGSIKLDNIESGQRPVFKDKTETLEFIQKLIWDDVEYVGINFAFPLEPTFRQGILDGRLIRATKIDSFEGMMDEPVGEMVEKFIASNKTSRGPLHVSVANDTICLLLAGLTRYTRENLAAGIIGTGYNAAFFIDSEHAVNLEAGAFSAFEQSEMGKIVDQDAQNSGSLFEKEISGAYLYQHFNLSSGISARISSTEEMDAIAKDESHPDTHTAQDLFKRSAQLVSTHIAGILEYKQRDMHFVMEGSLFWNAWQYRNMVEEWTSKLSAEYTADFFQIVDSELYGAAKLVA